MARKREQREACMLAGADYAPGDPAPEGYLAWHEWAQAQHKAGLRQRQCGRCSRWKFPQEMSDLTTTTTGTRGKNGPRVTLTEAVCLECVGTLPASPKKGGKRGNS